VGTIVVAAAVGTLNCLLRSLFPIWDQVWGIVRRPLFIASCIFYIYEDLPEAAQAILWWNPLAHTVGLIRSGFYPTYQPTYVSLEYVFLTSLAVLAFALLLLRRHHRAALAR
jgi:capsular polysaccharide transport system permease protein